MMKGGEMLISWLSIILLDLSDTQVYMFDEVVGEVAGDE